MRGVSRHFEARGHREPDVLLFCHFVSRRCFCRYRENDLARGTPLTQIAETISAALEPSIDETAGNSSIDQSLQTRMIALCRLYEGLHDVADPPAPHWKLARPLSVLRRALRSMCPQICTTYLWQLDALFHILEIGYPIS